MRDAGDGTFARLIKDVTMKILRSQFHKMREALRRLTRAQPTASATNEACKATPTR